LKSAAAAMLENADVLVQNLAPGAAARMGLSLSSH
jgi:crotonobetainyl-CoA:carnitine CoA-transferase CaiB-like acyl-CoA transferase